MFPSGEQGGNICTAEFSSHLSLGTLKGTSMDRAAQIPTEHVCDSGTRTFGGVFATAIWRIIPNDGSFPLLRLENWDFGVTFAKLFVPKSVWCCEEQE